MPSWLDSGLLALTDTLASLLPDRLPDAGQLHAARIVSHRGERDNLRVFENTYAAFDPLRGSGVWGLELDVRWTRDLQPMVFHDADLRRLFGSRHRIAELSRQQLQADWPMIPGLDEFVARYSSEFHLMVELKQEPYRRPDIQSAQLAEILEPARKQAGFHLISLAPALLDQLPDFGPEQTLGVARFNVGEISREAMSRGRAGIGTQYALLATPLIRRHLDAAQAIGVGFPSSPRVMRRQIQRGAHWIFTNQALAMQRELGRLRELSD